MEIQTALNYTLFTNQLLYTASHVLNAVNSVHSYLKPQSKIGVTMVPPIVPLWKLAAMPGPYLKLAALSGTIAVGLGAYGSHRQYPKTEGKNLKEVFETASRYHFFHTLAMLALPLCRTPYLAGTFLLSGTVLFCGTCYYYAFTGNNKFKTLTPIGGICFMLGWLSMCI
ncbi:transmembrane protein 256-like [Calliopsis andreniformis]|uniref:transmembrane protein 256-like n=1 Tax=Calliopsis andreniformis TaxID=337506 RepID=UPI003FCEAAB4